MKNLEKKRLYKEAFALLERAQTILLDVRAKNEKRLETADKKAA